MTTSAVIACDGVPSLLINGELHPAVAAYVGPDFRRRFHQAGIRLFTFSLAIDDWWLGIDQYDFAGVDAAISAYVRDLEDGYFMPRLYLGNLGATWWPEQHPGEVTVVRDQQTGAVLDARRSDPRAARYLGHEVDLRGTNLHSFHSEVWRRQASQAIAALIAHCEQTDYADRLFGWHLADGLFGEWFHWHEYSFAGLADYSSAASRDFRRWLRVQYSDDIKALSRAWGRVIDDFESLDVPLPHQRCPSRGEFYDPVKDRPAIDYHQCLNDATADSIIAVCQAAKQAMTSPKVVCVFYGYQFSNMPRPQLNGHYALDRVLASPAIDMIASPHSYSHRGLGGYHAPQAVADSIRRAGKLHFDEIDCKTVWTPTQIAWKRHINQPETVKDTVEMMKKDAAYQLASATGLWWMDLTNQGWFDDPKAVTPIWRLKRIEERLQVEKRHWFGDIALVVSQRAMMFQACTEGLHNASLKMFRNWHLSRIGAPFEHLLLSDLARPNLKRYKLYIMANTFYLSAEERDLVSRVIKRNGATVLWVYAPGWLTDSSADLANMQSLTGFRFGMSEVRDELNVRITDHEHPLTRDLPELKRYGTGVDRSMYQKPPKIQYMPDTKVTPHFYVADPDARVLGVAEATGQPGLAVREFPCWRSIYSAAPVLSWQLMQSIARWAGVHIYNDQGDMLWANNAFLALYSQHEGTHRVRFPHPVTVEDAYAEEQLGQNTTELVCPMGKWETMLLYTKDSQTD